ncbi:MAG: hypothetical protein MO846_08355 [Candidatus Devosia symbiotica]|nr:hypothetical protein [Candidatus Devosia symbiotica]
MTILVPEGERDKTNSLVGMVTGIGFLATSVISGFLMAYTGMLGVISLALVSSTRGAWRQAPSIPPSRSASTLPARSA